MSSAGGSPKAWATAACAPASVGASPGSSRRSRRPAGLLILSLIDAGCLGDGHDGCRCAVREEQPCMLCAASQLDGRGLRPLGSQSAREHRSQVATEESVSARWGAAAGAAWGASHGQWQWLRLYSIGTCIHYRSTEGCGRQCGGLCLPPLQPQPWEAARADWVQCTCSREDCWRRIGRLCGAGPKLPPHVTVALPRPTSLQSRRSSHAGPPHLLLRPDVQDVCGGPAAAQQQCYAAGHLHGQEEGEQQWRQLWGAEE